MKRAFAALCFFCVLACCAASASDTNKPQNLRVIRANAGLVDIREGSEFRKGTWRISPRLRPDVYLSSKKDSAVVFYTDCDSISCVVNPAAPFDFVILLNGRDSAFTRVAYKPTHLDVLKMAREYNVHDTSTQPQGTFRSQDDPELKSIRLHYALDSVAGSGDEQNRIVNILHWVHNNFRHDGSRNAPDANSIQELMEKSFNGKATLDCGSLAYVLNSCYLSLGYRSRRIVCLPKDSTDFDCHSITSVYSPALGTWVWVDPTFDAYVMDEHDRPIGIAEVRERLIDNRPLKLNADANRNHVQKVEKDYYLYDYMAKNLYAVEYFFDAGGETKAMLLLPAEYKGVIPRTRSHNPICTTNPLVFWAVPK
jgi:hypothetical protein